MKGRMSFLVVTLVPVVCILQTVVGLCAIGGTNLKNLCRVC